MKERYKRSGFRVKQIIFRLRLFLTVDWSICPNTRRLRKLQMSRDCHESRIKFWANKWKEMHIWRTQLDHWSAVEVLHQIPAPHAPHTIREVKIMLAKGWRILKACWRKILGTRCRYSRSLPSWVRLSSTLRVHRGTLKNSFSQRRQLRREVLKLIWTLSETVVRCRLAAKCQNQTKKMPNRIL